MDISRKPFQTRYWTSIKYITPNYSELKMIAETLNIPINHPKNDKIQDAVVLAQKVSKHIDNVIVTLGDEGLIITRRNSADQPLFGVNNTKKLESRLYPALKVERIINVSGAGDCFASGLISAMLKGLPEEKCVSVGLACAISALNSSCAVPKVLFDENHSSWKENAHYIIL